MMLLMISQILPEGKLGGGIEQGDLIQSVRIDNTKN